jgi:hypothetical protein
MSHNVSRGKQDEIARKRRLAELEPYLVPGWQLDPGKLQIVAVKTVLGQFERGQQLLLRCKRADCRRRMEVDLRSAIQAGKGHLPPHHLIHLLKCNHWAGCQFEEASSIYPDGVPLVAYLNEDGVLIGILMRPLRCACAPITSSRHRATAAGRARGRFDGRACGWEADPRAVPEVRGPQIRSGVDPAEGARNLRLLKGDFSLDDRLRALPALGEVDAWPREHCQARGSACMARQRATRLSP